MFVPKLTPRLLINYISWYFGSINWIGVSTINDNWDDLFLNKNCPSPKDEDNLQFRNNDSQLIVNCANNHPITSLFRDQLYKINEQKRDVYKKYYEPYN